MLSKEIIGQPEILTTCNSNGRETFQTLQGITKLMNRRPGDVITPSLVHLQAEQQMSETRHGNAVKAQESQISKNC